MISRPALLLLALVGCGRPAESSPSATRAPASQASPGARPSPARVPPVVEPLPPVTPLPASTSPAPARLVAIGDVHGDLAAFRAALRTAGAIDDADRWSGGTTWIVQTGDVLDRGDDEDAILAWIERLENEARAAGGRVVALNGNHELMNAQGDFRYVTPEGFSDFDGFAGRIPPDARARIPERMQGRVAAFAPGGPLARVLAGHATAVRVGDTVFVHGGISPRYAEVGLDAINADARAFLLGEAPLAESLRAEDGPVWNRAYAQSEDPETCASLERALAILHATRMVVGHTTQEAGITSACEGHVWRIDVGLARHYGGPIEVLEIAGDDVRVLRGRR